MPGNDFRQGFERRIVGHLRLCSQSLFFEPIDESHALIRLPFHPKFQVRRVDTADTQSLASEIQGLVSLTSGSAAVANGSTSTDTCPTSSDTCPASTDTCPTSSDTCPASTDTCPASSDTCPASTATCPVATVSVETDQFLELKKRSPSLLYRRLQLDKASKFVLRENHATEFLDLLKDHISFQEPAEQRREKIHSYLCKRFEAIPLPTDVDPKSCTLTTICRRVYALVAAPVRLMLTSDELLCQPFNQALSKPLTRAKLKDLVGVEPRRLRLLDVGLELFFRSDQKSQLKTIYLEFHSKEARDDTCLALTDVFTSEVLRLVDVQNQWVNRKISNFDYLMYLNVKANRSFHDLTQYPVFPWVLSDFSSQHLDLESTATFRDLSKPVGALNEKQLAVLKKRYQEMNIKEKKFLYGTHYSTPLHVLYYLVRQVPEFMLRFTSGHFDLPDRLFFAVADTFNSVVFNNSDHKELIPEFYATDGEFLLNSHQYNFGIRQDGQKIGDVRLPPWATDATDFVNKSRAALECDYVSERLHLWLDLVFGYKQSGSEAEKADNVYYYLTYAGAVDLESVSDPLQRTALEVQMNEFGQAPKQLFLTAHPQKLPVPLSEAESEAQRAELLLELAQIHQVVEDAVSGGAVTVADLQFSLTVLPAIDSKVPAWSSEEAAAQQRSRSASLVDSEYVFSIPADGERVECSIDLLELTRDHNLLVVGGPGSGKSWLLLQMLHAAATERCKSGAGSPGLVPLLVPLGQLVAHDNACLSDWLRCQHGTSARYRYLRHALHNRQLLLLLDALDETLKRRKAVLHWLTKAVVPWGVRVIISTRDSDCDNGYTCVSLLGPSFRRVLLGPLSTEAQNAVAERRFDTQAVEKAAALLTLQHPSIRELVGCPLLLSLLLSLCEKAPKLASEDLVAFRLRFLDLVIEELLLKHEGRKDWGRSADGMAHAQGMQRVQSEATAATAFCQELAYSLSTQGTSRSFGSWKDDDIKDLVEKFPKQPFGELWGLLLERCPLFVWSCSGDYRFLSSSLYYTLAAKKVVQIVTEEAASRSWFWWNKATGAGMESRLVDAVILRSSFRGVLLVASTMMTDDLFDSLVSSLLERADLTRSFVQLAAVLVKERPQGPRRQATEATIASSVAKRGLVSECLALMTRRSADLRLLAVATFQDLGVDPVEVISTLLSVVTVVPRKPAWKRAAAVHSLRVLGAKTAAVVAALIRVLKADEEDTELLLECIRSLEAVGANNPQVVDALVAAVHSSVVEVSELCCRVLAGESFMRVLLAPPLKRWEYVRALTKMGVRDPGLEALVVTVVKDLRRNFVDRIAACEMATEWGCTSDAVVAALVQALSDPEKSVRTMAARALQKLGCHSEAQADHIAERLGCEKTDAVRTVLVDILCASLTLPAALGAVVAELGGGEDSTRMLVLGALPADCPALKHAMLIGALHQNLDHGSVFIRIKAATALISLGCVEEAVLSVLFASLEPGADECMESYKSMIEAVSSLSLLAARLRYKHDAPASSDGRATPSTSAATAASAIADTLSPTSPSRACAPASPSPLAGERSPSTPAPAYTSSTDVTATREQCDAVVRRVYDALLRQLKSVKGVPGIGGAKGTEKSSRSTFLMRHTAVRLEAIRAVSALKVKEEAFIRELTEMVASPPFHGMEGCASMSEVLMREAVLALAQLDAVDDQVGAVLLARCVDPHSPRWVRVETVSALAHLHLQVDEYGDSTASAFSNAVVEALLQLLINDDSALTAAVQSTLRRLPTGLERAMRLLAHITETAKITTPLDSAERHIHPLQGAVRTIGKFGTPALLRRGLLGDAVSLLLLQLTHSDPTLRLEAVRALESLQVKDELVAKSLLKLQTDSNVQVKTEAAIAVSSLVIDESTVDVLLAALNNASSAVDKERTVKALASLPVKHRQVLQALVAVAMSDPGPSCTWTAPTVAAARTVLAAFTPNSDVEANEVVELLAHPLCSAYVFRPLLQYCLRCLETNPKWVLSEYLSIKLRSLSQAGDRAFKDGSKLEAALLLRRLHWEGCVI